MYLVSVEPSAPQPSPPMPSIRLRPCETCGFLPRRLLRPGPPVIQAPLRALCSEIPKTHGRSSERQRCSLRSRADREFTRLPGPYSQAYIQTQHYRRTSRHLSRAIPPSPSHQKQHPLPHSLPSHQQTHPYTTFHCRCPAYPQGQSAIPCRLLIDDGTAPLYAVIQSAST